MTASLQALLTGVIDYAGMFPPAGLDLEPALRNYAAHRQSAESWMLARFICPVTRLPEIGPLLNELFPDETIALSVLGRGGDNREVFCSQFREDMTTIEEFRKSYGQRGVVEAVEVRLPPDWSGGRTRGRFFRRVIEAAEDNETPIHWPTYYEMTLDGDWRDGLDRATEHLSGFNQQRLTSNGLPKHPPVGMKVRCGGLEPAAFPTPEQVTTAIEMCRDREVPLKFTAGLHHPVRHLNADLQTSMHGFINVFSAGVLAYSLGLEHKQIRAIVEEEDPSAFSFEDDFFGWREAEATVGETQYARRHRLISFGSCSFDDPRDDLKRLTWL